MNIEISLVKTSQGSSTSKLISRSRAIVSNDGEAMQAIHAFIQDRLDTLSAIITDRVFFNKLKMKEDFTVTELNGLRLVLLGRFGIDLLYYQVSDGEKDEVEIPDGMDEIQVWDTTGLSKSFVPFVFKYVEDSDNISIGRIYKNISQDCNMFKGDLFDGMLNPIESLADDLMKNIEAIGGGGSKQENFATSMKARLAGMTEQMGKYFIIISN